MYTKIKKIFSNRAWLFLPIISFFITNNIIKIFFWLFIITVVFPFAISACEYTKKVTNK
ncbi:hypothetical protein [Clostridium tarantellae]|uniref:hypothetical protein n=1 Tax=Clostridium tarantellae TaxID=39493 RepID=UPI001478578E|nr:hypothetical protein [Clostridium tarantellae]